MSSYPNQIATGYTVQVSKNNTFTQIVATGSATPMNYTPTADLPHGLTLYWHVRANGANGPSAWSGFDTYITGTPPGTPTLSAPASNALVTSYTPLLTGPTPAFLWEPRPLTITSSRWMLIPIS
jgi:hypothetical protein